MQVIRARAGNHKLKGAIFPSAYGKNGSTAGTRFAVKKDANFRMDEFSVSAKL